MNSKPTLRDIAEATGVSTASVSMILNGKSLERFSSQRVASVLAEAERIGYRTPSARCAGKQIAILSPSVSNPYHTMMISGIDAAASAAGYPHSSTTCASARASTGRPLCATTTHAAL